MTAPREASAARWLRRAAAAALALACALVLAFLAAGSHGADLFPVYMAGRLFDAGRAADIFVYDPAPGPEMVDPVWIATAAAMGYGAWLYAFVFPPLWAALAAPLAAALDWPEFNALFAALNGAALVAGFAVAADLWAPPGARRRVFLLSLLAGLVAWPVVTSVAFNQVQAIVTLLVLLALREGERGRPASAGLALALAASVKLTPALFGVYWLLTGRFRAAAWSLGWGAALLGLNFALGGLETTRDFLDQLMRIAAGTPTSHMNQSLLIPIGAALGGLEAGSGAAPVNALARALAAAASLALFAAAALRLARGDAETRRARLMPALMIILLTASPLAWIHYFTFLVPLALSLPGRIRFGALFAAAALGLMISNTVVFQIIETAPANLALTTQAAALLIVAALIWGEKAPAPRRA